MAPMSNVLLPMPDEQPCVDDALLEFITFPAAKHDDRVDATSHALLWLRRKRNVIDGAFMRAVANDDLSSGDGRRDGPTAERVPDGRSERR